MPMPTVVGVGAANSGAGAVTASFPGGYTALANDCAFTFIECESADTVVPPSGWSTVVTSTQSGGTTTELVVIYKRLVAAETAPAIADAGDHMTVQNIILRGCKTSGTPWDYATGTVESVADTTVSIAGGTTLGIDRLVIYAFSTGQDVASSAGATAWANATLANVAERMDTWAVAGLGGGFSMMTGEKAAAGAAGTATATLSLTANFKAHVTIAVIGDQDMSPRWTLNRGPRPSETMSAAGPYAAPNQSGFVGG